MAGYYALRLFQRTMHGRKPDGVRSREISLRDAAGAWCRWSPASSALAFYPQLILQRTDDSATVTVQAACIQGVREDQCQRPFRSFCAASLRLPGRVRPRGLRPGLHEPQAGVAKAELTSSRTR